MISATFPGSNRLVERLKALPALLRVELLRTVRRLTVELQTYVKESKLSGQVLHNRTGTLRRSIYFHVLDTATAVLGEVGTNLGYGVAWERGIKAHDIVPVRKKALAFNWKGRDWVLKRVHIPAQAPRSFLASALADKAEYIRAEIIAAMRRSAVLGLRGAL